MFLLPLDRSDSVSPIAFLKQSKSTFARIIPQTNFEPTEALGAGVDRIPLAATDKVFSEPVLKQILSTGWQTVTYRQNTELYVEAWHWNPKGTWSEPGEKGYFVGDATPTEFIRHSFGYPLPHAGFSQPDGRGYSRLTDGDINTYWKSNPYLTKAYTERRRRSASAVDRR